MRRPLWVEIGLNLGLLTVAASLLNGGVYYLVTRAALADAAAGLSEGAGAVIAAQLAGSERSAWPRVVEAHRRRGLEDVTVWGPDGSVLAGRNAAPPPDLTAAWAAREVVSRAAGDAAQALVPVGAGRPLAVVGVSVSNAQAGAPAWSLLAIHAVFSAASIAVFGFVLLRGGVLRPIEAMRAGTARIAAGEFGVAVSTDAPAELADLAAALNQMSAALAAYRERTAEQVERLERANAELRAAQDALVRTERLASVGRLAAGLAHELGNPLAAVRGYVELLCMDAQTGRADADVLVRCAAEVERMHGLIRGLLDFARQERPSVAEVDVAALLEAVADTVRPRAEFRSITLRVAPNERFAVLADASKLQQVLVNLLLNAADAGARTIRLGVEGQADTVAIVCGDDGHGIAASDLPRLFEPFFTTRPPGAGTGLGLAIAHRIAEEHGGRIEVESTAGAGATFRLVLPTRPVPAPPSA